MPNLYFKKLAKEFEGHPYQDRLLEELQHHVEDYCHENNVEPRSVDATFLTSLLGEEKKLKKTFVSIVDPWKRMFYLIEGLLLSIGALFMGLAFYSLQSNTYLSIQTQSYAPLLYFALFQILWLAIYDPIFSLLKNIKPYTTFKSSLCLAIIVLPGFSAYLFQVFSDVDQTTSSYLDQTVIFIVTYFSLNSLMGYVTWILNHKRKSAQFKKKKLFIYAIIFMLLVVGRTVATHMSSEFLNANFWILALFFPIILADTIILIPWNHIPLGQSLSIYLPGVFLLAICILELAWLLISKKNRLLRSVVFLYTLSLFFVGQNVFKKEYFANHDWVNVSQQIEKMEGGLFYNYKSYIENIDRYFFGATDHSNLNKRYEIAYLVENEEGFFQIRNQNKKTYIIPEKYLSFRFLKSVYLIEEVTTLIENAEMAHSIFIEPYSPTEAFLNTEPHVKNLVFSQNQKWAMLVVGNQTQEVFLLKMAD